VTSPYELVWRVPDDMPLSEASTISMCGLTAAQGVFYRLGLPCPFAPSKGIEQASEEPVHVLIYGASTSLGLYAAQMVQRAASASKNKIRLIGVASTSKHELLRAAPYSYDVLVDYRDADWPEAVRQATGPNGIQYAVDTISEGETVTKVHSTFGPDGKGFVTFRTPQGGKYNGDLPVKPVYGAVWEGLGVEIGYNVGYTGEQPKVTW